MAEGEQDKESKTEDATPKRLQEAHDKGQVATSREVGNALAIMTGTIVIVVMGADVATQLMTTMRGFIERPEAFPLGPEETFSLFWATSVEIAFAVVPVLGLMLLVAVAGPVLQHGLLFSAESIKPKWSKLSPMMGLKRIFSARGTVELVKNLLKMAIVGTVSVMAVAPSLTGIDLWVGQGIEDILSTTMWLTIRLLIGVTAAMIMIAILDYAYQLWEHHKSMRMTKQEVRDEGKQQEGDPHVKSKIRALRVQRARRRMMAAVPEADVVVTNPTHFAVALKYDQDRMAAPRLVAKGADQVALRIREVAREHGVPLVENPPLARALFAGVELDQEIPEEHYRAVAQIISYVMKLKARKPATAQPR